MSRWFASRWMVISVTLSAFAFGLSVYLDDATAFTAIATATIALGQAHNIYVGKRDDA